MEDFSLDNLNDVQTDILGEIGNIGMGNVATSLSSILDKRIGISVPRVNIVGLSDLSEEIGMAEKRVAGILFTISNDLDGMMMFVLEERFAKEIINILNDDKISGIEELNEVNVSVLQEVANIMAGSYLNAISSLTDFRINMSVPFLAIDMLGAIMSVPAIHFGEIGDKVLLIEEKIIGDGSDFDSYLILIPTVESLKKLLDKVGGVYGNGN
ncbi:MAG: chemotaxis protein CheC [Clostridia bacterium]|nr:chemotaxis protein CheC [Clostridia bacterium]